MNIIFLDVDGPLIPGRLYHTNYVDDKGHTVSSQFDYKKGCFKWDPVAVDMITELCRKHAAKVVFSTSHNEVCFDTMKYKALCNNMSAEILHEDVRTKFAVDSYSKKDSIVDWLRAHPEVINWVVVDDEEIMPSNQVKVNFNLGITIDDFFDIEEWLKGNVPDRSKHKLIV